MRIYFIAARIIDLVESKQKNIKTEVYNAAINNKKALYAIVCETLKFSEVLETILGNSGFLKEQKFIKGNLAYVLVYEMLFGNGTNRLRGRYLCILSKYKNSLNAELARLKLKKNVFRNIDLISDKGCLPRYVRVNTLKLALEEAVQSFQGEGYHMVSVEKQVTFTRYVEVVKELKKGEFLIDIHVDNLLVFATGTDLHTHPLYTSGQIILQDKASCLPGLILAAEAGSEVIDACAAPGNKTTHVAAIMSNTGRIFAVDHDQHRVALMNKLLDKVMPAHPHNTPGSCIEIINSDFLQVNPESDKYKHVKYILLDPSCSGSGIVSRLEKLSNADEVDARRVQSLSKFQAKMLWHALKFPGVQRVVYSTCSVHSEENEEVVRRVLASERVAGDFSLLNVLPSTWPVRGEERSGLPNADYCIRASHALTLTNGFFVAVLERQNRVQHQQHTGLLCKPNMKHKRRNKRRLK